MIAVAAVSLDCQEGQRLVQHREPGLRRRLPYPFPPARLRDRGRGFGRLESPGTVSRVTDMHLPATAGGIWGESFPFLIWWIFDIDMYVLFRGAGRGKSARTMLENNTIPPPQGATSTRLRRHLEHFRLQDRHTSYPASPRPRDHAAGRKAGPNGQRAKARRVYQP